MKKKHHNRILGREKAGRTALWRGLMSNLLRDGSIVTTEAKAKELRLVFEPLITKAKNGESLAVRRQLVSALGSKTPVEQLLAVAQLSKNRPGGYLRLTRMPQLRGDATRMMRVDFVDGK